MNTNNRLVFFLVLALTVASIFAKKPNKQSCEMRCLAKLFSNPADIQPCWKQCEAAQTLAEIFEMSESEFLCWDYVLLKNLPKYQTKQMGVYTNKKDCQRILEKRNVDSIYCGAKVQECERHFSTVGCQWAGRA